ncbi:mab-21-like 3 [Paramuricea clavata]|uniref:Mab-21-like 3 n=1 Tax=Paramuricea clavata TaxID=317549 RepID=A0A7D9JJT4_PARCT|nr:mab-21-like 3 [Paramuricea clavata]
MRANYSKKLQKAALNVQAMSEMMIVPHFQNFNILVVCGGVIPPQDYDFLFEKGVAAVFGPEPPDMDFMCVLKNITFSQEDRKNGGLQQREDTPFVYAFVTKNETQQLWGEFFHDADTHAGKNRLSSRKLKEKLQDNYQKTSRMFHTLVEEGLEQFNEGAAATVLEKITQSGFHIVPKSSPDGDFRLSFFRAESMLIGILLPLQHRVMSAFKTVVKYYENTWSPNLKEIISSYHLKTIAFWHFEKTSQKSWTEETLLHHLVTLFQEFAEVLGIQNLPMYFMPKFNLLQDVDDPEVTLDLMEKISQLAHNFSAISEAVHNCNLLKLLMATASDHYNLANIFVTLREEKLKKAQENCEVLFTFYDVFVAMEKLVNRLM